MKITNPYLPKDTEPGDILVNDLGYLKFDVNTKFRVVEGMVYSLAVKHDGSGTIYSGEQNHLGWRILGKTNRRLIKRTFKNWYRSQPNGT